MYELWIAGFFFAFGFFCYVYLSALLSCACIATSRFTHLSAFIVYLLIRNLIIRDHEHQRTLYEICVS